MCLRISFCYHLMQDDIHGQLCLFTGLPTAHAHTVHVKKTKKLSCGHMHTFVVKAWLLMHLHIEKFSQLDQIPGIIGSSLLGEDTKKKLCFSAH